MFEGGEGKTQFKPSVLFPSRVSILPLSLSPSLFQRVSQYRALLICLTSRLCLCLSLSSSGSCPPFNVLFIQIWLTVLLPLLCCCCCCTLNCRPILLCNNLLLQLKSPLLAERIHINHGARFMATQRPRRGQNARVLFCIASPPSLWLIRLPTPCKNKKQKQRPPLDD